MARKTALLFGVLIVAASTAQGAARPDCPDDVCTCLGQAAKFDVVAGRSVKGRAAKVSASGSSYVIPAGITGRACADTAAFGGSSDDPDTVSELVVTAPGGIAASFKAKKIYGTIDPGTQIDGDLATGGGAIKGLAAVSVGGAIDTSGTHADVAICGQAMADIQSASAMLAGLAPTQDLGSVSVTGGSGSPTTIVAGPGVNVINTTGIRLKAARASYGYRDGSQLLIDMAAGTDSVIINTGKLSVGAECQVSVTGDGGDPSRIIINLVGKGSAKISKNATVDAMILAAGGKIGVRSGSQVSRLFSGAVSIKGAQAGGLATACSPSGAFVDSD